MAERDDTMDADLRDAAKEYLVRYGGDVSSDSGTEADIAEGPRRAEGDAKTAAAL
jgi:hypothetical protein